jgi:hypothetical protein
LEVKVGFIELFLFPTQVSPSGALALCCVFVVVSPSHGDILSGVQLVTELSNSLVPKLFQVSRTTQQQPCRHKAPNFDRRCTSVTNTQTGILPNNVLNRSWQSLYFNCRSIPPAEVDFNSRTSLLPQICKCSIYISLVHKES